VEADIPRHVLDYLAENKTLTLATASPDGDPHAATLLYVNDGITLYIWSKIGSATAEHLKENPRVALAIDEYAGEFRQTRGVQASGDTKPVTGETMAKAAALFGEKYPDLSPGGSTATISFFEIEPRELHFIDNSQSEKSADEFGFSYERDRVFTTELPAQGA
jgi:uncharacterized protein YhbP (UPF0306 family)